MTLKVKQADGTWRSMGGEPRNIATVYPVNNTSWGSTKIPFYGTLRVDYSRMASSAAAGIASWSGQFADATRVEITRTPDHTGSLSAGSMFRGRSFREILIEPEVKTGTSLYRAFDGMTNLTKVDGLGNTSSVVDLREAFRNSPNLTEIAEFDASGVSTAAYAASTLTGCTRLTKFLPRGLRYSISVAGTAMQADDLNSMFSVLGQAGGTQVVTITGTPGAATCNRSIATNKGWTVTG